MEGIFSLQAPNKFLWFYLLFVCLFVCFAAFAPTTVVIYSVVVFLVGLLLGLTGGALVGFCWHWHQRNLYTPPPPVVNPFYEEIDLIADQNSKKRENDYSYSR